MQKGKQGTGESLLYKIGWSTVRGKRGRCGNDRLSGRPGRPWGSLRWPTGSIDPSTSGSLLSAQRSPSDGIEARHPGISRSAH